MGHSNRIILFLFLAVAYRTGPVSADDTIARLEQELKIVSVPLVVHTDGSKELPVHVRVQSRCIFGDFEALLLDMLHSEKPLGILTLEPILPDATPLRAATALIRKPQDLILSGFSAQLPVADTVVPQLLALSLCKDGELTQRCRDKDFIPINEILAEYKTPRKENYNPKDRVYTYAFVVIRDGRAYTTRARFAPELKSKWKQYLRMTAGGDPDFESSFELFWKRVGLLGPYPVGVSTTAIVLTLPRYDAKKCVGSKPEA